MRRRYDDVPPPELLLFEGHLYPTEAEWCEAFDKFCDARERWLTQRGLAVTALPPYVKTADCPWNPDSI